MPVGWSRGDAALKHAAAKPVAWVLALMPLGWLIFAAFTERLGANPAESLVRSTGDWSLRLLCLALAVTPLRLLLMWPALARYRRLIGLFAAFYTLLHLTSYALFDMGLDGGEIVRDVVKRPFILVGFMAGSVLAVLAVTSIPRVVRAMGGSRWRALHRLVYAAGMLSILHFFWMRAGKRDFAEVAVYAAIMAGLLGWRLIGNLRKKWPYPA